MRRSSLISLAVGIACLAVASVLLSARFYDIIDQLQGKCDYRPCLTPPDSPMLVVLVILSALGFFLLGMAAAGVTRRR
jgi:hypothetical protein